MALNLGYAISLCTKQNFRDMWTASLVIRVFSIITYLALLWGLLLSILFLMGPDRNKHIFLLMILSFFALNLSGAFYAVPLVLQLRKVQKISAAAVICCNIFAFIIGFDLLALLLIRKKCKTLF